jgi:hypothetical protein
MAKYVGKIFRVDDKKLKIHGNGSHYVHVKWYNPFTRKFRCRVITSLEDQKYIPKSERHNVLSSNSYYQIDKNTYNIFNRRKYRKLRSGDIEPIPTRKMKGFKVWSGYFDTRDIHVTALKGNQQKHMSIKK